MCVRACVCVWEREREREGVCVCALVFESESVWVWVWVCGCEREREATGDPTVEIVVTRDQVKPRRGINEALANKEGDMCLLKIETIWLPCQQTLIHVVIQFGLPTK